MIRRHKVLLTRYLPLRRFGVPGVANPDPDPEVVKFAGIVDQPATFRGVLLVRHQGLRSFGPRIKVQRLVLVVIGLTVGIRADPDPFLR